MEPRRYSLVESSAPHTTLSRIKKIVPDPKQFVNTYTRPKMLCWVLYCNKLEEFSIILVHIDGF